jgi:hypothetical protein
MKQVLLFFSFLFLVFSAISQEEHSLCAPIEKPPLTEDQVAYAVDAFGNEYTYQELLLPTSGNSSFTTNMSDGYEGCNCSDLGVNTEYFNLWFEDCNSGTDIAFADPIDGENRRRVACEVFAELAQTLPLQSNTSCNSLEQVVNIQIGLQEFFPPDVLGLGGGFYKNRGINDNKAYLVINGIETSNSIYHGHIRINFTDFTNWYYGTTGETLSGNFDLQSVVLHEALHVLGFHSKIQKDGGEPSNFHRYDDHIYMNNLSSQTKLLDITAADFDYSFNTTLNTPNDLFTSCQDDQGIVGPDMVFKTSSGLELPLFASSQGHRSSFSHFDYDCDGIPNSNYVMLRNIGEGVERSFTNEEKEVFATMGYTVESTSGNSCEVTGVYDDSPSCGDSYSVSACSNPPLTIYVSDLLHNDLNANSIASIRVVNSFIGGSISSPGPLNADESFIFTPTGNIGTAYLEYIPEGCSGELGNITRVQISVTYGAECGPECGPPLSCDEGPEESFCTESFCSSIEDNCNLICNSNLCGSIFTEFEAAQSRALTNFDENNFVDLPIWGVAGWRPAYHITPSFGDGGSIRLRGGRLDWSDGVFTPLQLTAGQKYFFSIRYEEEYAGTNDQEDNLINISRIELGLLNTSPPSCGLVPCYSGPEQNILDIDFILDDPEGFRRTGTNFIADNISADGLWLSCREGTLGGEPLEGMFLDNIEVVPDYFTAGEDQESLYCNDPVVVGGKFCMLSDVEVLYEWIFEEEILASYSVSNGEVSNVNSGEVNMDTHEATLYPTQTGIYTLKRSIQDFGGLEETIFDNCIMGDDIFIDVHSELPDAEFSVVQDCGEVSFESMGSGNSHSWDFESDGIEDSQEANPVVNLPEGTYNITHLIITDCGVDSYEYTLEVVECEAIPDCCPEGSIYLEGYLTIEDAVAQGLEPGTPQNLCISGTLLIGEDFEFPLGTNITMLQNSEIRVLPDVNLKVRANIHGCDAMWKGILLTNGASADIRYSNIENALSAVRMIGGNTLVAAYSIFRYNFIGISDSNGTPFPTDNNITIGSCTFHCRDQTLLPPYQGKKTYAGLDLQLSSAVSFGNGISASSIIFDDLANGIIRGNGQTSISSCRFINIGDANSDYNINGYGIYSVNLTGSFDQSVCYFENCTVGIFTRYSGGTIRNNEMVNVEAGVRVELAHNDDIIISNNEIHTHYSGISLWQNDGATKLQVTNNDIFVNELLQLGSYGIGISINDEGSIPYEDAVFSGNDIYLYGENHGIYMQCSNGISLSNNEIFLENATSNLSGITINQGSNHNLNCNDIEGSGTNGAAIGIMGFNPGETKYSCNQVSNTNVGMLFWGDCIGTDLKGTTFNNHSTGLFLGHSVLFGSTNNSNLQEHNGNKWFGNYAPNSGAVNHVELDNIPKTAFIVDVSDGSALLPSISTPNASGSESDWFLPLPGNTFNCPTATPNNSGCPLEMLIEDEITEIDRIISRDELELEAYAEVRKWLSERYLYRKLQENPNLIGLDGDVDNFRISKMTATVGKLQDVEMEKKEMYKLEEVTKTELSDNLSQLKAYLQQLREIDEMLTEDMTAEETTQMIAEKNLILNLMQPISNSQKDRKLTVKEARTDYAEWVKTDNGLIYTSKIYEANEKSVSSIYLETIAKNNLDFDASMLSTLTSIANQCPLEGGNAVFKARSILTFFDLENEVIYDDESMCTEAGILLFVAPDDNSSEAAITHSDEPAQGTIEKDRIQDFSTAPNPALETFRIFNPYQEDIQILYVYDILGRLVKETVLNHNQNTIDIRNWHSGVYQLKIFSKGENIWSDKIVIL